MALKIFVCGLGNRARSHVQSLGQLPEYDFAGGYDPSPAARETAQQWPAEPVYTDLTEGLSAARPDCILIATPPKVRLQLLQEIIGSEGLRVVIVEKPLALSHQEAVAMYDLCEAHGVTLVVAHQLRYCREFQALKETVRSGRLGRIRSIQAGCYGKLFDQGSHMVDLIRWLDNDSKVVWADATANDEISVLAKVAPIPADFKEDTVHPGHLWSAITLRLQSGTEAFLGCGLLDAMPEPKLGPWLQKRIIVTGSEGVASAHVASHFEEISSNQAGSRQLSTNLEEYEQALGGFYQALAGAMQDGTTFQQRGENLHTLDTMLAALRSADERHLQAVSALAETTVVTPGEDTQSSVRLSIILPMEDHRGMGAEAVASWTRDQWCAQEDFELIVIIDRNTKHLENEIRPLLRPHDQLVYADMDNEMAQYHHGATLARGENLLFTEPHCIAEPQAVDEIIRFFSRDKADGLCVRSTPITANRIAMMESRMYEEGFANWSRPEHWGKVIVRGFAIRKRVYLDAGGYNYRYDRFAEWLLAATLRQRGVRLLYLPGAGVAHAYDTSFSDLARFIREFTDGECEFRLRTDDPEFCYRFFEAPPEWTAARAFRPEQARQAWLNLWQILRQRRPMAGSTRGLLSSLAMLFKAAPLALLGKRYLLASYQLPVLLAKTSFYLHYLWPSKQYQDFLGFWMGETALCRVKMALAHPAQDVPLAITDHLQINLADMPDSELYGFFPEEHFADDRFRWSGPLSAMRLQMIPADYQLKLSLLPVRKLLPDDDLAFFINDQLIEDVNYSETDMSITINIKRTMLAADENWLYLVCRPWRIVRRLGHDERELGLPITEMMINTV